MALYRDKPYQTTQELIKIFQNLLCKPRCLVLVLATYVVSVCHLPAHTCHSVKGVKEQPEHNEKPWIKGN